MKIEKISANTYRVRKTLNKKTVSLYFDHKPSDVDIAKALARDMDIIDTESVKQTFEVCATEYITLKTNVLSPSTIRSYDTIIRGLSEGFKSKNIDRITQIDIQMEVNRLSADKSAKTIANYHGFISAVFGMFRPNMIINTTLPQKVKFEPYTPTEEDIKRLLNVTSKNDKYSVAFQLGVLGLRRSEIAACCPSDIVGNYLSINKAKVQNTAQEWVIKNLTKTEEGKRKIYIPDSLVEEISDRGCIYEGSPAMMNKYLQATLKKLNIPQFRFHDLRAFYCSYAHSCGIPDNVVMASGGWRSDFTMKKHYRRVFQQDVEYYQEALASDLLNTDKH